jgi:alanine racemase
LITIAELAERSELSPYEVLTGLRERLPRHFVNQEQGVAAA